MERVYNVSYDLKSPGQNYTDLISELKKSSSWWHYLDSTWLIRTQESASQLWERISSYFDKNDYALIIEVGKDYQGWLPEKAWEWIKENVT